MTIKHIASSLIVLGLIATTTSCMFKKEEKPSPLIGKATESANQAAWRVTQTDHSDTLAMQNAILEAKVAQTEFQVARDTAAVGAFNRAFKKYLQQHDPELAKEIFIERPANLPKDEPWDEFEQYIQE